MRMPSSPRSRWGVPLVAVLAIFAVVGVGTWVLVGRDAGGGSAAATRLGPAISAPEGVSGTSQEQGLAPFPPTTTSPRPSTPAPTSAAPTSAPAPSATPTAIAAEVIRLTNVERAKAGCVALRFDARLTAAAQAHSEDMVNRNYFSHTSPDGRGPGDRAAAAGYPNWSGENIAGGYPTPAAVVQGWMNSSGHRANILNCQSKAIGVGLDPRQNMWPPLCGFV